MTIGCGKQVPPVRSAVLKPQSTSVANSWYSPKIIATWSVQKNIEEYKSAYLCLTKFLFFFSSYATYTATDLDAFI